MGTDTLPVNRCDQPPWVIASPHFNRHPLPLEIQGVRRAHQSFFSRLERLADPAGGSSASGTTSTWSFKPENGGGKRPPRPPVAPEQLPPVPPRMDARREFGGGGCAERVGREPLRPPPVFHAGLIEGIDSREYLLYLAERMRRARGRTPWRPSSTCSTSSSSTNCDVGIRGSPPSPCTGESATSRITGSSRSPAGTAPWSG